MKRCPECRRDYYDDSLSYCLDDGSALLEGPASEDPKTALLPEVDPASEAATRNLVTRTGESAVRPTSSAEYLVGEVKRHKIGSVLGIIVFVGIVGGLLYFYRPPSNTDKNPGPTNPAVNIRALIATGNIRNVAISPDGKFLAFVKMDNGQESLWTKQISTNSDIQLQPPTADMFYPLSFNPSGDLVYFGRMKDRTVYRIPVLGGTP